MEIDKGTIELDQSLKCKNCGANLKFMPGTHSLVCNYCNVANEIAQPVEDQEIYSYDYFDFINAEKNNTGTFETNVIKCNSCGATMSLPSNITSEKCSFCAAPLVIDAGKMEQMLKPHYILPFVIDQQAAEQNFRKWISGLWFAPYGIGKKISESASSLNGVYLPHWTFDTITEADYTGKRGDYYYTTETYTENVNGQEQVRSREVRHTNWSWVNGRVEDEFADIIVSATNSLSEKSDSALKPWDMRQLVHFDDKYFSGFRSESYQIKPADGFEIAKHAMAPQIKSSVLNDIGGDEQVIEQCQVNYTNIGIKYVLLPVWISSYRYNNKTYQFIVNANTGWVTGERPLSWLKIFLCVLAALIVISIFVLGFMGVKLR